MTASEAGLVPLHDARDERTFGGKAVHLGAAIRAELPVPDGFALSTSFVDRIDAGDAHAVESLRAALSTADAATAWAARSSALGEDSSRASFAGQHLTCLNVVGVEATIDAVKRIRASGRSEAALAYRKRLGIEGEPRVAVVVQRLVVADVAGVLFTRDPTSGADERVIEASWGLGESVVSGLVTPDRFRITREGRIFERVVGNKDLALRPATDGGTEEIALDERRASMPCLEEAMLLRLHALAVRCEDAFPAARGHDLEFAFVGDRLYLLQRRAITR